MSGFLDDVLKEVDAQNVVQIITYSILDGDCWPAGDEKI